MIPDEFSAQYGPLIQAAPQFELQAQPQILSAVPSGSRTP